jgi:hypothetical protein
VVHVIATPPLALAIQSAVRDGLNNLAAIGMLTIHQGSAAEFFPALNKEMAAQVPQYTGTKIPGNEQRAHMEEALRHYAQTPLQWSWGFWKPSKGLGTLALQRAEKRMSAH